MKKVNFKKYMNVFIIVLICCIPLYCGWKHYYNNYILVQNVFDHMYYAKAYSNIISEERVLEMEYHIMDRGHFDPTGYVDMVWYSDKYLNSPFNLPNQDLTCWISSPLNPMLELKAKDYDITTYGGMLMHFRTTFEESINEPYEDRITIGYDYDVCDKTLENELYITRTYVDEEIKTERYELENREADEDMKRILNERGISEKDIEKMYKWLLYDKILPDWFKANEGKTRFSMDDLGKVEFIE